MIVQPSSILRRGLVGLQLDLGDAKEEQDHVRMFRLGVNKRPVGRLVGTGRSSSDT
jgi:hypothetical protein